MNEPIVRVSNLYKSFGKLDVLIDINFEISENLAIVGESGGGKTTLLRILAGLETYDKGEIDIKGKVGFVFQDFNLFPHLTVWENITLAAPDAGEEYLIQMNLLPKKNEYPCKLSGGQKQRAAIARALALKPDVLCFDEPTSALDPRLTDDVAALINSLDCLCIIVTHDMDFADKVAKKKLIIGASKVVRYADLAPIDAVENGERFMLFQGLMVRESVYNRLNKVAEELDLELVCGHRSLSEQKARFEEQLDLADGDIEAAHAKIAEPTVAGHPTGGAVDVRIKGMPDLLFENCEYDPRNEDQRKLNEAMLKAGFAPFLGEWWHFSYGDKEWAAYYGMPHAIYEQKDLDDFGVFI